MSMYLHTPALEAGSWWRVDTASGSDTATTVYAHDGSDAIPTALGTSGSTVRNSRADGTALFWSSTATLYCKELTYQGVPTGTVVTSTGATPTTTGGAGSGGPVLGGPNVWTGTQDFTGATVTGVSGGGAASLLDRGNWATSTVYAVGDVTTQAGQRYAARVAHTSGTFATDLAATKWVSLDAVAAAASARTVTAGTGLTGGGDLTADRTLTVAYGTTSGTAAQGNDSRITGALQAANNLSDVTAASARTNLGLGTAALISSTAGGDLSGTLPSPTVAKVNGVAITGTPSTGYVPTATGSTTATWQAAVTTFAALTDVTPGSPTYGSQPVYDPVTSKYVVGLGAKWRPDLGVYNLTATSLGRWRAGNARARAGGAACHVIACGDSTTDGDHLTGEKATAAWPARLQSMLSQVGRFGAVRNGISLPRPSHAFMTDSRWVAGTGWSAPGSVSIGGSGAMSAAAGAAGTLDFTPNISVDTFIVYYVRIAAGATMGLQIDAGSTTTVNTSGADAILSSTVTVGSAGTHTLHISSSGSGTTYVYGVEAYDSTATLASVKVSNFGITGTTSANWTGGFSVWGNGDSPFASTPDLAIVSLGINDRQGNIDPVTYKTNMQTVITKAVAKSCDVLLCTPPPQGSTQTYTLAQYVTKMYELADTNSLPLVDLTSRWQSYAVANASPYNYMADTLHPIDKGAADWASVIFGVLLAAA